MTVIDFEKIGKYKIIGKLGQGSFGVVYQARDAFLKRDVAIKICSVEDEGLRERFFREAEISGKLVHKNIVTVYEFGFESEIPYLVQEMLSGEDLSRIVKRRAPLAPGAKLEILLQVANGLGYAHREGVIHRDIKPGNVRVLEDGVVKIMDFGIAKLASAETQLTQKGVTMGTASYLPPEQVRGGDLDQRADIFSFGVLAYELMTYERPFRGGTLSALIYQILYKVPQPMLDVWPQAPEPLSELIARCLEKKPERRYSSFAELIPELIAVRDGVRDGRWPALDSAASAAEAAAAEAQEPSDVLSPGTIARTARGVLEGKVGDYTISTAASAREVLRPPGDDKAGSSTRPIDAVTDEEPEAADLETLKTQILPVGQQPSPPPIPGAPAEGIADDPALATTAQAISDLVAQGELEAAKEQLEATMSRTGVSPPPIEAPPADVIDEARPTEALRPSSAAEPPAAAASDTYRTVFRPPFDRLKWAGLAAGLLLVSSLGWLLFRGDGDPAEPEPPPEPVPDAVPAVAPEPATGGVAIHAGPWALVTEIADAEGALQEIPEAAQTPLYLELPPGRYTIQLSQPAGDEVESCEIEVVPDSVTPCMPAFAESNVTEFFKESGWWR